MIKEIKLNDIIQITQSNVEPVYILYGMDTCKPCNELYEWCKNQPKLIYYIKLNYMLIQYQDITTFPTLTCYLSSKIIKKIENIDEIKKELL
jgi:hypothetical protein